MLSGTSDFGVEVLHESAAYATWLEMQVADLADRCDLGSRTRDEDLRRPRQIVVGEAAFDDLDALTARQSDHRTAGSAHTRRPPLWRKAGIRRARRVGSGIALHRK